MTFAYLSLFAAGLVLSVACLVHTPDPDRRRAYPDQPEHWSGMTGQPSFHVWTALLSPLFWSLAVAGYGVAGIFLAGRWPGAPTVFLSTAAGFAVASVAAHRMLRHGPGAMTVACHSPRRATVSGRPRVLFIGGSPNQTTQMEQIAAQMPDVERWFTPYFSDHWSASLVRRLGLLESAILGHKRRGICLDYLNARGLRVDLGAEQNHYDLYLCPNDQVLPPRLRDTPFVLVQEGIQDPPNWKTAVWKYTRLLPRAAPGTSTFGLTKRYERFCVASEGYRDHFRSLGVPDHKLAVTGIPNFDDFAKFLSNDFPHRDYVLACTTDARETYAAGDRDAFLRDVVVIARGRPLIFKLHPNEDFDRARREIHAVAPHAKVFTSGTAEEMVANCSVLVTEWSSLTFCGVALGKEVYSHHPIDKVRQLLPIQNRSAAANIAEVSCEVLAAHHISQESDRRRPAAVVHLA